MPAMGLMSETICVQPHQHWYCFEGSLTQEETAERKRRVRMGLSERYDATSGNRNAMRLMKYANRTTNTTMYPKSPVQRHAEL